MTKLFLRFAIIIVAFAPVPAFAQYDYYSSGSFGFNQNNYPDLSGRKWKKPGASSTPPRATTTPNSQRRTGPTASNDLTTTFALPYTRDRAYSKQLRAEFLVDMVSRGTPTSELQLMAAMTTRHDFVQTFAGLAQLQGLDSGTPEGIYALFYGQTWAIANKLPLPSPQQYQVIAKQLRDINARARFWNDLSNRDRQTLIERLAYPLVVQKINYENYRSGGRAAALADMATRVQAGMKNFKMDMQATKLTPKGFDPLP